MDRIGDPAHRAPGNTGEANRLEQRSLRHRGVRPVRGCRSARARLAPTLARTTPDEGDAGRHQDRRRPGRRAQCARDQSAHLLGEEQLRYRDARPQALLDPDHPARPDVARLRCRGRADAPGPGSVCRASPGRHLAKGRRRGGRGGPASGGSIGTAVSTKCAKAVSSTRNDCRRQLVSITHLTDRATTSFASATGAPEMRY